MQGNRHPCLRSMTCLGLPLLAVLPELLTRSSNGCVIQKWFLRSGFLKSFLLWLQGPVLFRDTSTSSPSWFPCTSYLGFIKVDFKESFFPGACVCGGKTNLCGKQSQNSPADKCMAQPLCSENTCWQDYKTVSQGHLFSQRIENGQMDTGSNSNINNH